MAWIVLLHQPTLLQSDFLFEDDLGLPRGLRFPKVIDLLQMRVLIEQLVDLGLAPDKSHLTVLCYLKLRNGDLWWRMRSGFYSSTGGFRRLPEFAMFLSVVPNPISFSFLHLLDRRDLQNFPGLLLRGAVRTLLKNL